MKKNIKKIQSIIKASYTFALIAYTQVALAAVVLDDSLRPEFAANVKTNGALSPAAITSLILQTFAGALIFVAGPLAVLMIVVGGYRYVTAGGEQSDIDNAKKTITYAIGGLAVIMVSYVLVQMVLGIVTKI